LDALGSEGNNWEVIRTTINGGSLSIADSNPSPGEGLSGIQVVLVSPELIFHDGFEAD